VLRFFAVLCSRGAETDLARNGTGLLNGAREGDIGSKDALRENMGDYNIDVNRARLFT
jgi:hypothetical protein